MASSRSSGRPGSSSRLVLADGMTLSLAVFGVTAYWFIRQVVRNKEKRLNDTPFHRRREKSLSDIKETLRTAEQTGVSDRGRTALVQPVSYLKQFLACFQNPCDPIQNPNGYIPLCMAENKLITQRIAERCMHVGTATAAFSDSSVYCYNSFLGMPVAREAAAYFLARRFLFPDEPTVTPAVAFQHIQPKHVALSAGAASILNNLFYILGNADDACLVPAPYYAAFENDMNIVAGVVPFPIQQANPMSGPSVNEMELAFMQAKSSGLNPRFLLLTNPHNPLAVIYKPEVVLAAVKWARKRGLQTISDEIYALSTHQKRGHSFQSIIRILNNELGSDVHFLWAVSKDFGASGLRYGILYSQNEVLMDALANLSTFSGVSGPIQYLVSELLTDDQFVDDFLEESRQKLVKSYNICTKKLDEMVLPYIPAEAGMFVYVDFSSLLPEKTFQWEEKLSDLFFKVRVVLTPGESQRDTTPGMYRICYAWVSPEILEIAMERLSRLVGKLRRMDWDDLSGRALNNVLYM